MLCQINQDIHHGDKVNSFVMLEIKQFENLKKEKRKNHASEHPQKDLNMLLPR
jgi:hypothetical protein